MANKFIPWIDAVDPGTNTQEQSVFASDSQRQSGFVAGNAASAIRVNSALRQANVVASALMQLADELKTLPDLDLNSSVASIKNALKASIIDPLTTRLSSVESSVSAAQSNITSILNGTTVVKKAEEDEDGNNIKDTYLMKSDSVANATNAVNVTTNINGKAISSIFESDGTTVKEATKLKDRQLYRYVIYITYINGYAGEMNAYATVISEKSVITVSNDISVEQLSDMINNQGYIPVKAFQPTVPGADTAFILSAWLTNVANVAKIVIDMHQLQSGIEQNVVYVDDIQKILLRSKTQLL